MNLRTRIKFYGLFLFVTLALACSPAAAEKRVALVVGNSNYKNAPLLPNPANDAAAVAATLKGAGFDLVDVKSNLPSADMRRALRDFADQARNADIAVVYYAGHGIEINGTNYLIPTDAALERDTDVYDEAYSLDRILLAIEPARRLRLVIVDACRNNPFADSMKRTVTSRSVSRGLARVEPESSNTLVAFAAKAGLTAFDGNSKNSPYAAALVKYIAEPGLDLRRAFGFIRDDVMQATGNRQEPYVYGSLGGEDVALVPAAKPAATTLSATPQSEIRREYELAVQVGSKDALNAFLAQRPEGYYASLAKLQLAQTIAEETRLAATEKARVAERERTRLAAAGAQAADQEKAAADAKAAEEARLAAERTKLAAQEQTAEAERKLMVTDAPASPVPETQVASNEPAPGKTAANPSAEGAKGMNLASLAANPSQAEITKSIQDELRRVGCLTSSTDGEWNAESQRALSAFNRKAGMKLNVKAVTADTLEAIRQNQSRVCPLACEHGFRADGDSCTKIVCAEGSFLNEDNECVKRRGKTPIAGRDDRDRRDSRRERADRYARPVRERPQYPPEASFARPPRVSEGGSPQIVCNAGGCRPVRPGCRIDYQGGSPRNGSGGNVEVCR